MAPKPKTFLLDIHGMTCGGCAARVERSIRAIQGASITVDLLQHQAQVSGLAPDQAMAAIRAAGYEASLVTPTSPTPQAPAGPDRGPRLWFAGLALALASVDMVGMLWGGHHLLPLWLSGLVAGLIWCWFGLALLPGLGSAIRHRSANMQSLIFLGTSTALVWSLGVLADLWQGPVYFEATTVVLSMQTIGQWLEGRARQKALDALDPYLHPPVVQARRLLPSGETIEALQPSALGVGDQVLIRSAEWVAVDGLVLRGSGHLDESLLTGESLPIERGQGQRVSAGTQLLTGELVVEIQEPADQWRGQRLARQLQGALMTKAPLAALADRISAVFVPGVLVLAVANALVSSWLGIPVAQVVERTIAILVVACPCALGLATPAAVAAGLAQAARRGWLFRHAAALEKLARVTHLGLDKTGTLTMGRPKLLAIQQAGESSRAIRTEDFPGWLATAAAAEQNSQHPLAGALLSHVAGRPMPTLAAVETLAGRGLLVRDAHGQPQVLVGSSAWMAQQGLHNRPTEDPPEWQHASCIEVAHPTHWLGRVWVGDALRPGAKGLLESLQASGLRLALISGDRRSAVAIAAAELGLRNEMVFAETSPEDKAKAFDAWRAQGGLVAMVGDGLNDALALGQADVGIALAAGAGAAIEAADVTLTNSQDLGQFVGLFELARATVARIRHNLVFAFGFNVLALPAAALGWLTPAVAGGAMALSAALVVGHAVGLLRWQPSTTRLD